MLCGKKRKVKKAGSRRESNPDSGLSCQCSATEPWEPDDHQPSQSSETICTAQGGAECTPGSHSVCTVRFPLGVDRKILSIRKDPMLSGFSHSKRSKHLASWCYAYEVKIEESEKAGSCQESNLGHLCIDWVSSALPLSHDSDNHQLSQSCMYY